MFDVSVPYISSGQQLGETRQAMAKTLMKDIENVVNKYSDRKDKYWILVHGKPFKDAPGVIKIKIVPTNVKPPMMLACILFEVDNQSGKLVLCWSLPGDWPTWAVGGTNEPVPEVIGSINELGLKYDIDTLLAY